MKSVVVTGASGFLGRHVVNEFHLQGWNVLAQCSGTAANTPFPEEVSVHHYRLPSPLFEELLRISKPHVLVHCAGSSSIHESIRNPGKDYESHMTLTHWLTNGLERWAPDCRFVYVSSAAVYGQPSVLPVSEDDPIRPLSPYGYHKRLAEMILEQASALRGLETVCARVFSAYGPGLKRQVVWETASQALWQGKIELAGTGRETRDFLHAEDVARALYLLAVKAPAQGEIFNVAYGRETSIRDLAEQIARTCGLPSPIFLGIPRNGDPARWCADTGRLQELGFVPRIPFETGLKTVLDWVGTEETGKK